MADKKDCSAELVRVRGRAIITLTYPLFYDPIIFPFISLGSTNIFRKGSVAHQGLYIALNRTPNIDRYWVGGSTQDIQTSAWPPKAGDFGVGSSCG